MDKAWIHYNPDDGTIIGISWEKNDLDDLIEISREMAESFMVGDLRTVAFKIIKGIDGPALVSIDENPSMPEFWNLKEANGLDDGSEIIVYGNTIVANVVDLSKSTNLFATLKHDPSWLIKTWNLRDFQIREGRLTICWPNADKHSFYMSKSNED